MWTVAGAIDRRIRARLFSQGEIDAKKKQKIATHASGGKQTFGRKQSGIERLEQRQLLAGDVFYAFEAFALPGPSGSLPADTSGFGGESASEVAEVVSHEDFSNRADAAGDRAVAPQTGQDKAAILAAARSYGRPGFGQMATTTPNRGLQPQSDGSWDQRQGKLTGGEHGISNPADRYAHLSDPLACYGTEGSSGYGHGGDDLYAGNGLHIPGSIGNGPNYGNVSSMPNSGGGSGSGGGLVDPQAVAAGGSFHWEPIPGSADAYLRDQLAEGQAWMDAHENGNPYRVGV